MTDFPISTLDAVAFGWFLFLIFGFRFIAGLPAMRRASITGAVQQHRVSWMRNMAERENRMLDGIVLQALGQGNAFFASTSAIAIGGLSALFGTGEKTQALLQQIPYVAKSSPGLYEFKILVLIAIFIFAFFKFAWAFRLSHYTGIMIGATPVVWEKQGGIETLSADQRAAIDRHAERSAQLIGIAADHANSGLRAFYYVIAALAWFFHPLAFMAATTWVIMILIRREFFSRSLKILTAV